MKGVEAKDLKEGVDYWLDSCMNESGIFIKETEEDICFLPNEDCSYFIDEDGYVKFIKPVAGIFYQKNQ